MYIYLLGLAFSNLCVLIMAIPALMSLTSTVDCSESYMMAHFHAHWMMPLLNCFMGNTGCRGFKQGYKIRKIFASESTLLNFENRVKSIFYDKNNPNLSNFNIGAHFCYWHFLITF